MNDMKRMKKLKENRRNPPDSIGKNGFQKIEEEQTSN